MRKSETRKTVALQNDKPPGGRRRRRPIDYGLLPELLGYHLRRAQVAVFHDFAAAVGVEAITPGQFGVLTLVKANEGLNQSELGEAMGVDRSTVVAVIDKLERRGLVRRTPAPNDRRSYALRLSTEGGAMLERLEPLVRRHEARIATGLEPAEPAQLIGLLERVTAATDSDS